MGTGLKPGVLYKSDSMRSHGYDLLSAPTAFNTKRLACSNQGKETRVSYIQYVNTYSQNRRPDMHHEQRFLTARATETTHRRDRK